MRRRKRWALAAAVGRFRWLTYVEWEQAGRSPGGLVVAGVEFSVAVGLVWVLWGEWWVMLVVPLILAGDYVSRSVFARRRVGPAHRRREPFRVISLGEWTQRARERRGLIVLGAIYLASFAGTKLGPQAMAATVLLYPADYLWCCASSGAWLASRPAPPASGGSATA